MDINKTIEFILEQQARFEANFAKVERVLAQNNRLVARLAGAGVALRGDVRRHERPITRIEENLAEATDKLNALVDFVDQQSRKNGRP